jgi:predicted  nucleic acid-binding Zn-ribbon protein
VDIEFEKLIKLQKLDKEITDISLFLDNIPTQIKEINKKIEASSQIITLAKEKMDQNQKKRRDLEAEVKDIKEQVSKYNRQLNEVKTNREYSSLLKEIEEAKQKVNDKEEEIIGEMLSADEIEEEIKTAGQNYSEAEQKFSKEKDALQQEKKKFEAKKDKLNQEKEKIVPKIPSDQVNLYLKIYKKNSGIALSPVNEEFCSLCHMRIRPQVINELKGKEKIILCENCGRILYVVTKSA